MLDDFTPVFDANNVAHQIFFLIVRLIDQEDYIANIGELLSLDQIVLDEIFDRQHPARIKAIMNMRRWIRHLFTALAEEMGAALAPAA